MLVVSRKKTSIFILFGFIVLILIGKIICYGGDQAVLDNTGDVHFHLTLDKSYYNPFAVSFRWDIMTNIFIPKNKLLRIRVKIIDKKSGDIIKEFDTKTPNHEKKMQLFAFLYDLAKPNPAVRIDIQNAVSEILILPETAGRNTSLIFKAPENIKVMLGTDSILFESSMYDGTYNYGENNIATFTGDAIIGETGFVKKTWRSPNKLVECNMEIQAVMSIQIIDSVSDSDTSIN